jgi:hypothetical protein
MDNQSFTQSTPAIFSISVLNHGCCDYRRKSARTERNSCHHLLLNPMLSSHVIIPNYHTHVIIPCCHFMSSSHVINKDDNIFRLLFLKTWVTPLTNCAPHRIPIWYPKSSTLSTIYLLLHLVSCVPLMTPAPCVLMRGVNAVVGKLRMRLLRTGYQ